MGTREDSVLLVRFPPADFKGGIQDLSEAEVTNSARSYGEEDIRLYIKD